MDKDGTKLRKGGVWHWALVFFVLFLPFSFALSPVEGVDLAVVRLVVVAFFVFWIIEGLMRREFFIARSYVGAGLVAFMFFAGLSIFIAYEEAWAFRKFAFLLSFVPLYFVVSALVVRYRSFSERLIKAIIVSGTFIACVGIVQFSLQFLLGLENALYIWRMYVAPLFLGATFSESVIEFSSWLVNLSGRTVFRAVAFFPDPHIFTFFLELCLPWAIFALIRDKKKIYIFACVLMLVALFLSFSRGAYVGVVFGTLFGLFYLIVRKKSARKMSVTYVMPIVVCIIALFSVLFITDNPIKNRFISSFDVYEGSNEGRLYMWKEAYRISKDNVILGVGLGNYPLEIKPSADYREPIYAHNLYLDIFVEMGLGALFAWVLMFFFSFREYIQKARENILYFGGVFSLGIFFVHAMFDTPLFSVHIFPLLLIILALGVREKKI